MKADQIRDKVRFVPFPENVIEEDYEDVIKKEGEEDEEPPADGEEEKPKETQKFTANVDFKALVYNKVPQREQEEEIPIEPEDGKEPEDGE